MFEVNPNPTSANAITSLADTNAFLAEQVMPKVYQQLQLFASDPTFVEQLKLPFGDTWDIQKAQTLATEWLTGNFSTLAPIKIVASADINGSSGGFAEATNQIYLAKDILTGSNVNQAVSVVLEEIGHSIDPRLNSSDSLGDEGEIFSNIVQGKVLSPEQIQTLKTDDDAAVVILDGENVVLEMNLQSDWNVWRYDDWRNKESDFWYQPNGNTIQKGNRPDGKDGIYINWGLGSPFDDSNISDGNNSDYFAVQGAAYADFEAGKTYKFTVNADNGIIVTARPKDQKLTLNGVITPYDTVQNKYLWQQYDDNNPQAKEYNFTPDQTGTYRVDFWSYDVTGNASVDISWEPTIPDSATTISNSATVTKGSESYPITIQRFDGSSDIQNRPTWLVIHGFGHDPGNVADQGLPQSIDGYQQNDQVLMVDWSEITKDNGKWIPDVAGWIPNVAEVVKNKLNEWGISKDNINIVGQSFGSYVGWEIANRLGGVNKFVALDPASDLAGYSPAGKFEDVSEWSWAFKSSLLGNDYVAKTADESFAINLTGTNDQHNDVMGFFASLINKEFPTFGKLFSLDRMNGNDKPWSVEDNWFNYNEYEATLSGEKSSNTWSIDSSFRLDNGALVAY